MKHSIQQGSLLDMPALERKEVKPSQPVTEKKMSRLEELIAELCPNGVEYRKLSDICGTITTGRLNANAMVENGKYPFFTCDENPFRIDTYAFDTTAILISGNGSQIGHLNFYSGKFNAYQRTYVLYDFSDINPSYLFHYAKTYLRSHILKYAKKGSVPYITMPMLEGFLVPVPPLPVQEEIVRILDNFAELTAELTAELSKRKQQYQYYRDMLLTFDSVRETSQSERQAEVNNLLWKTLKDICQMKAGKAISASEISKTQTSEFCYECFGGNGVRGYVNKINKNGEFPIIGRQGALCGNVKFASGAFYATEHAVVVSSDSSYIPKFLYYLLQSMKLNQYKSAGAQPGLSVEKLEKIIVPVPSLDEQKRIVAILDRFDALCNDLTSGLPAEIEARKKQYEYYRDKLLTFKEAV